MPGCDAWPADSVTKAPSSGPRLNPLNQKGLAEGGDGSIKGDIATFRAACVNTGSNALAGVPSPVSSAGGTPPGSRGTTASSGAGGEPGSAQGDFGADSGSGPDVDVRAGSRTGGGPEAQTGFSGSMPDMSAGFTSGADLFGACLRVTRIEARPDSRIIWMRIDIGDPMQPRYSFVLSLYRIPRSDADPAK